MCLPQIFTIIHIQCLYKNTILSLKMALYTCMYLGKPEPGDRYHLNKNRKYGLPVVIQDYRIKKKICSDNIKKGVIV